MVTDIASPSLGLELRQAVRGVAAAGLGRWLSPGGLFVAGDDAAVTAAELIGEVLAADADADGAGGIVRALHGQDPPPRPGDRATVLCASFAGDSEPALAAYRAARRAGLPLVVAAAGGPLVAMAAADGTPSIVLHDGDRRGDGLGLWCVATLGVAEACGLAPPMRSDVQRAARLVDLLSSAWGPEGDDASPPGRLARALRGTVLLVVGSGTTAPVARRWAHRLGEDAGLPVRYEDARPGESAGALGPRPTTHAGVTCTVVLEDRAPHPDGRGLGGAAAEATGRDEGLPVHRVHGYGQTALERALSLVVLGDLTARYLATAVGCDAAAAAGAMAGAGVAERASPTA